MIALCHQATKRHAAVEPFEHQERQQRSWPLHHFVWDVWQNRTHVAFLKSYLKPVLHGSRGIYGYSDYDEEHSPTVFHAEEHMISIPLENLKFAFHDYDSGQIALGRAHGHDRKLLRTTGRGHPSPVDIPACTQDPMPSYSYHVPSRDVPEDTRGMFRAPMKRGGLAFKRTVAALPRRALTDLAEEQHPLPDPEFTDFLPPPQLSSVIDLAYDGENLVVRTVRIPVFIPSTADRQAWYGLSPCFHPASTTDRRVLSGRLKYKAALRPIRRNPCAYSSP